MPLYEIKNPLNINVEFKMKRAFLWIKKSLDISVRYYWFDTSFSCIYMVHDIHVDKLSGYPLIDISINYFSDDKDTEYKSLTVQEFIELRYTTRKVSDITYQSTGRINTMCIYNGDNKLKDIILFNDKVSIKSQGTTIKAKILSFAKRDYGYISMMVQYLDTVKGSSYDYINIDKNGRVQFSNSGLGLKTIEIESCIDEEYYHNIYAYQLMQQRLGM